MKIAVIGTGMVGAALGTRWSGLGHKVMYGVRNLTDDKLDPLKNEHSEIGGIAEAVAWADVVALAVPYDAITEVFEAGGSFKGKILFDCTNPLAGLDALQLGTTTSAAEQVQELAEGAQVVKVFNTIGYNVMQDAHFPDGKPVMFYAGDDDIAKEVAHNLAFELGFDPVDAGPLTQARLLEPFALLWITLAYKQGLGREIGFKLMRR